MVLKSLAQAKEEWYVWDEIILKGIVAIREMNDHGLYLEH